MNLTTSMRLKSLARNVKQPAISMNFCAPRISFPLTFLVCFAMVPAKQPNDEPAWTNFAIWRHQPHARSTHTPVDILHSHQARGTVQPKCCGKIHEDQSVLRANMHVVTSHRHRMHRIQRHRRSHKENNKPLPPCTRLEISQREA